MIATPAQVLLRPMRLSDLPQVTEIDRLCFPTPWPARSYRYELSESRNSSMFVVCVPDAEEAMPVDGQRRLLNWLSLPGSNPEPDDVVVGYSGFWFIVDEVHISTIGVHPDWQGHSLGDLLMYAMLRESVRLGALRTTLEVRVSNTLAQNLYRKYRFEVVGRRRNYYRDNREDAWTMAANSGDLSYARHLAELGEALFEHVDVIDEFGS